jgi:hypothetical protein
MAAKSQELAREASAYRCTECQHRMRLTPGLPIPSRPHCGNDSFDTGIARAPQAARGHQKRSFS